MAKSAQIQAQPRQQLGTRANRRLRQTGVLPGVIYGHKEAIVPITVPSKQLAGALEHGAHLFDLNLGDKSEKVLVKEVQYDHLGKDIIHVDFARVSLDERVEVTVAIELKGEPVGEKEGGVLQQIMNEIEVECLVTEIPDMIVVDVSELKLDDEIRVKDLKLPAGVKTTADEDQVVCSCHTVQEEVESATEGTAEPEVIGKVADDETAEEAKK